MRPIIPVQLALASSDLILTHAMLKKLPNGSYLEAGDNEATEQELQDVAFTAFSISVIAFTILITITIHCFT